MGLGGDMVKVGLGGLSKLVGDENVKSGSSKTASELKSNLKSGLKSKLKLGVAKVGSGGVLGKDWLGDSKSSSSSLLTSGRGVLAA